MTLAAIYECNLSNRERRARRWRKAISVKSYHNNPHVSLSLFPHFSSVQETVHKAEQAASQAAQESIRHGHKAETRVLAVKKTKHAHAHGNGDGADSEIAKHDKKHQVGG